MITRMGRCDSCGKRAAVTEIKLLSGRVDSLCLVCLKLASLPLQSARETREGHTQALS